MKETPIQAGNITDTQERNWFKGQVLRKKKAAVLASVETSSQQIHSESYSKDYYFSK